MPALLQLQYYLDQGGASTAYRHWAYRRHSPDRISGLYYDERGRRQEGVYHDLRYLDRNGEESVQFLTVNVEKEASDNGQS